MQVEDGHACEVHRSRQQPEFGVDAGGAADSGAASAVAAAHEVTELALDFGSGAAVVGDPGGVGLPGAGIGEGLLVGADADRAPADGGGALRAQRALGTGLSEVGGTATGRGGPDRGADPGRADDRAGAEVDIELVLGNNPPAAVGAWVLQRDSIPASPSRSWNGPVP